MTTTFETAKVGDRVWSIECGWGEIFSVDEARIYPIKVEFQNGRPLTYTLGGKPMITHERQTLFWDEVKIDAPQKPMPELQVDAKVLVWKDPDYKYKRHFSNFKNGQICTFDSGRTSFTATKNMLSETTWPHWELAE